MSNLSFKIVARVGALIACVLFMHAEAANGGVMQQCATELKKFCEGKNSDRTQSVTCLRQHRNELGQDCSQYMKRLNSAIEVTGVFKSTCAEDYQANCGAGPFKIGTAQSCMGSNRDLLSEKCGNAYDEYFSKLKKISHSNGDTETAAANPNPDEQADPVAKATGKIAAGKAAVEGMRAKYGDPRGMALNKMGEAKEGLAKNALAKVGLGGDEPGLGSLMKGDVGGAAAGLKGGLLKKGKGKGGDLAKAAMGKLAGNSAAGKLAKGGALGKFAGLVGGSDDEDDELDDKKSDKEDKASSVKKKAKSAKSMLGGFLD